MKRFLRTVFGDNWGMRSVDGYAAPNSVENRLNIIRFVGRITVGTASAAVLAVVIIPLSGQHLAGAHVGLALLLLLVGILFIAPVGLLAIRYLPFWSFHLVALFIEMGVIGALAFAAGPALSPYVALPCVIYATVEFLATTRATAMVHIAGIGLSYGIVLAVQRGNEAPVTRWIIVMGAVVIVGQTVGLLVDRMRDLALAEHRARDEADAARAVTIELNRTLEQRVSEQVDELERLGRLRRFLSTPVADAVLSSDNDAMLAPHRREIAVFFCDLRGFTAFAANAQPEDVLGVLSEYFDILGELIGRYQATVGAFTGDGLMAFFNDPLPCDDPALRATSMATELRTAMEVQLQRWRGQGHDLGFGVGIAFGFANLGMIGFEGRRDYSALGSVVNLASRLCGEARSGQILIDQRAHAACGDGIDVDETTALTLKGYQGAVPAFSVARVVASGHR